MYIEKARKWLKPAQKEAKNAKNAVVPPPHLAGVQCELVGPLLERGRLPLDDGGGLAQRQLHEEAQAHLQEQPGRVGHAGL